MESITEAKTYSNVGRCVELEVVVACEETWRCNCMPLRRVVGIVSWSMHSGAVDGE